MSASGLERSLNLAGIWPVNLQYLIPKTGALSTNKLFCGALFRCQDPCRRAPFRFCAFGSMGGNWEDEVFRHARHFHALSVARTAVHGNRNHHQSTQLTHAASHLFLTCLYTCSGPGQTRLWVGAQQALGPACVFVVLPGSRVKESFRPVGEIDSSLASDSAQSVSSLGRFSSELICDDTKMSPR